MPSALDIHAAKQRDAILALAGTHGIQNLRVFGSVARGEDTPDSDIDFLVDVESGRSLTDLCRFSNALTDLLQRKVDVIPATSLKPWLKDQILSEARQL